ncbi:hypothetical protein SAMN05518846_1062 [Brevibacillus centrosporus]|uniref:Uncharacterized protein n=1 Tax=Brevibacillus centrosporus TaxID=54910 RepID=A0A1I3UN65_9BACL|nr:hypothetical protein SAMN05518846_1062 [Brevibacillus centrosporus]
MVLLKRLLCSYYCSLDPFLLVPYFFLPYYIAYFLSLFLVCFLMVKLLFKNDFFYRDLRVLRGFVV